MDYNQFSKFFQIKKLIILFYLKIKFNLYQFLMLIKQIS